MYTGESGEEQKNELVINHAGKAYMLETARWSKFLGIVYSVFLCLLTLALPAMLVSSAQYAALQSETLPAASMFIYCVMAVGINIYPLYALIKFANLVKAAVNTVNQQMFDHALRVLKSLFKYIGILTIIILFLYGIIIVFLLAMGLTSGLGH